jgi:hypothetical protein
MADVTVEHHEMNGVKHSSILCDSLTFFFESYLSFVSNISKSPHFGITYTLYTYHMLVARHGHEYILL